MIRRPVLSPIKLLRLLFTCEPVHQSMFMDLQDLRGVQIETSTLRVLRKQGWLHDPIDFCWVLTDKGRDKVRSLEKVEELKL